MTHCFIIHVMTLFWTSCVIWLFIQISLFHHPGLSNPSTCDSVLSSMSLCSIISVSLFHCPCHSVSIISVSLIHHPWLSVPSSMIHLFFWFHHPCLVCSFDPCLSVTSSMSLWPIIHVSLIHQFRPFFRASSGARGSLICCRALTFCWFWARRALFLIWWD